MYTVLMIQYDALEYLKAHAESPPWIILQEWNESGAVKAKRVSDGVFFNYVAGMPAARSGSKPGENACGTISTRKLANVIGLIWVKGEFTAHR